MAQVAVMVAGRTYRMACEDGQESHLEGLGRRLDETFQEMRETFGEIGDQRLTVMAAVLMTDRLDEAERKLEKLEAEVARVESLREDGAVRAETMETQLVDALQTTAARIERLSNLLGSTLDERAGEAPAD